MTIKELRAQTGLSQNAFAEKFHIPLRTLRDWEQDRRHPPVYVLEMMQQILDMEKDKQH